MTRSRRSLGISVTRIPLPSPILSRGLPDLDHRNCDQNATERPKKSSDTMLSRQAAGHPDGRHLRCLIDKDNTTSEVWTDGAYRSQRSQKWLAENMMTGRLRPGQSKPALYCPVRIVRAIEAASSCCREFFAKSPETLQHWSVEIYGGAAHQAATPVQSSPWGERSPPFCFS